jgi:phage protein U
MHRWLKANKLNRKNSRQWVGIRREEGGRLGGAAGGNLKDRAFSMFVHN